MMRPRSIPALAASLGVLAVISTGCARMSPQGTRATTTPVSTGGVVTTATLTGSWKPVSTEGMDARPDALLRITSSGEWQEFGYTLHYRMLDGHRAEVWFNGAHTIHVLQVHDGRLSDRTPSAAVRVFERVK